MQSQTQPELELKQGAATNRNSAETQHRKVTDPWDYSDDPTNVAAFLAEQGTLLQKQEISLAELLSRVSGLVEEIQLKLVRYSASLEEYRWKLASSSQLPQPARTSSYGGSMQEGGYVSNEQGTGTPKQLALTPPPDPVSTIGIGSGLARGRKAQTLETPLVVVDLTSYRAASRAGNQPGLRLGQV